MTTEAMRKALEAVQLYLIDMDEGYRETPITHELRMKVEDALKPEPRPEGNGQELDIRLVLDMSHKDYRKAKDLIDAWHKSGLITYSSVTPNRHPIIQEKNEDFEKFLKKEQ